MKVNCRRISVNSRPAWSTQKVPVQFYRETLPWETNNNKELGRIFQNILVQFHVSTWQFTLSLCPISEDMEIISGFHGTCINTDTGKTILHIKWNKRSPKKLREFIERTQIWVRFVQTETQNLNCQRENETIYGRQKLTVIFPTLPLSSWDNEAQVYPYSLKCVNF